MPESLVAKLKAHMPGLGPKEARWKHESSRFAVGTANDYLQKVSENAMVGRQQQAVARAGCMARPAQRGLWYIFRTVIPICLPRKRFIGREDWSRWSLSGKQPDAA